MVNWLSDGTAVPTEFESDTSSDNALNHLTDIDYWQLAYHTARNMRVEQICGILDRKLRHAVIPRLPVDFDAWYERQIPSDLSPETKPIEQNLITLRRCLSDIERNRYRQSASEAADGRFTFIGRTIAFEGEIDWNHEKFDEHPIDWQLKLQGFEHLEWLVLGDKYSNTMPSVRSALEPNLHSWAVENSVGEERYLRRSWIPHSVSLRILNWSRYAAWRVRYEDEPDLGRLYRAIYKNALFLENHIEYGTGGNHLIENSIALIMAGVLFENHDTGWIETGLEVMKQASETQFLPDGGHFERSPMYHVMVLRRYATACDLLSGSDFSTTSLRNTAERALGFLSEISKPDAEIPLLNDAVHGEQLNAETCISYSNACGLRLNSESLSHPDGSGYRRLTTDVGTLLIDVGDVGPSHLPAHSHNDHLSILLWMEGKQILADTGVYDYESNERRQYSRSIAAHNTAQYADAEPIPIGGSFLMGKRTSTDVINCGPTEIEARYSRETLTGPQYEHRRKVMTTSSGWNVIDSVRSDSRDEFTIRYHFHPTVDIRELDGADHRFAVYRDREPIVTFDFCGIDESDVARTPYFRRFGRERVRPTIEVASHTDTNVSTSLDGRV